MIAANIPSRPPWIVRLAWLILAIYAVAPPLTANRQDTTPKLDELHRLQQKRQAEALARGVPAARIVFIQNANHFVFTSNEEEVLSAMHEFLAKLP